MWRRILSDMAKSPNFFLQDRHQKFVDVVWGYYRVHQRSHLPWRATFNPYHIVVSELMLQQTQVVRVVPKYRAFLQRFRNTKQLAEAPLVEVLRYWQGLGYNRRAKYLQQCAQVVHTQYSGRWPRSAEELEQLPGIGSYTAAAVAAFAYNQPTICIETNIRTAVIHHYFPDQTAVSDVDVARVVQETLDVKNPREWYWALMDYGSYIKQTYGNRTQQAKSYAKQSRFVGSDREIRGVIIQILTEQSTATVGELCKRGFAKRRVTEQCQNLCREGLLQQTREGCFQLAE